MSCTTKITSIIMPSVKSFLSGERERETDRPTDRLTCTGSKRKDWLRVSFVDGSQISLLAMPSPWFIPYMSVLHHLMVVRLCIEWQYVWLVDQKMFHSICIMVIIPKVIPLCSLCEAPFSDPDFTSLTWCLWKPASFSTIYPWAGWAGHLKNKSHGQINRL